MEEEQKPAMTDAEKQAEALLQQHREDQGSNRVPHKNHRLVLAMFFVVFLALITGLSVFLLGNTDSEDAENEPAVSQIVEPEETEPQESVSLASEYLESYTIDDTGFGTMVTVTVNESSNTRTIERNALPNHNTGEFPNQGNPNEISAQDFTQSFPLNPTFTGNEAFARTVGVAINGVKFEPDTAERATCDGNVVHNIEAIQDVTDLGLDFNNAHVQPTGEYHYHGVSDLLVGLYETDADLVHIGFAADGHLMYYSKSNAYKPSYRLRTDQREGTNCSYTVPGPNGGETIQFGSEKDGSLKSDWDFSENYGDLDACNGTEINGQYIYLITDEYPYIGRCLNGEFSEEQLAGEAPGGAGANGAPSGPPPGQGPPQ